MRKFLITILAALCCGLTIVAVGCQDSCNQTPQSPQEYTVVFTPTENLTYICDELEEGKTSFTVKSGATVSFSVEVPFPYTVPTVYANDNPVTAQGGVYSVINITSDVTIRTGRVGTGTSLIGSGTAESPVLISNPLEYFTVAQLINSGDASYISLYYALDDDIDFGGEEIPVIGDGSTNTSLFMGNFNGMGYTLSNFKINTRGASYVGIFGYLVSSGQADETGVVANLNIDNFEITAEATSLTTMFVGSLVGYSMAANVIACNATNGSISVIADTAAFSYVGGAIGAQTSAIITSGTTINYYPALTGYVSTDVNIEVLDGGVLATGGVIGAVVSENERAISAVVNSYSKGDVFGGIYSGGVVGNLSDYSSMANCYSLSEVYAYSRYRDNEIYSDSYAGGLVGYIGNNAIVTDSFTMSNVSGGASSGTSFAHTGDLVGGKASATWVTGEGLLINCYAKKDVETKTSYFKNTLYWKECDWVFVDGSYPVVNMTEQEENSFIVTFNYSGKTVEDAHFRHLFVKLSENFYSPLFYYYQPEMNEGGEEFGDTVISDDGETSYGFFFDEELTQRVPYGFIPTRAITLYTGFTDYGAVAGTYYLLSRVSQREIKLTLNKNGTYTYNDGVEFNDFYTYDGNKLIFNNALFARLSSSVTVNEDNDGNSVARPDLNYNLTKFAAKKTERGLEIYEGSFFTEADPLIANRYAISGEWYYGSDDYVFYTDNTGKLNNQSFTYTLSPAGALVITGNGISKSGTVNGDTVTVDGNTLSKYDVFKGLWEISSNLSRAYEFDGKGKWISMTHGAVITGDYTIGGNGVATLTAYGLTAEIDASGLLLVKNGDNKEYYVKHGSFSGTWVDFENNVYIYFDGFGSSLSGSARIKISGATSELTYILDGFFDGDGNTHITLLNGYSLFAYLTVNEDGSLAGTFFAANTLEYFSGYNFYLLDSFEGEWIGEGSIDGNRIDSLEFNGLGFYDGQGSVTINGEEKFTYTLDYLFDAIFADYKVEYDGQGIITLKNESGIAQLFRKDEISSYVLISEDGIKFTFNGGGNLSNGGKLTITNASGNVIATLGYKNVSGSIADLDLVVELYSEFRGTSKVGQITIVDYKFDFVYTGTIADLASATLTIDNPFTGTWSASDFNTRIIIGTLDLSNKIEGRFLDMTGSVTFNYLPEYECLEVAYQTGEMTTATLLYLILMSKGNMVISSYNVLTSGDYVVYCALSDTLYGSWINRANGLKSITFDGMSDSLYTVGIARNESGDVFFYTHRFGTYYYWSSDGENAYIIERDGSAEGENVYVKTDRIRIVFKDFDINSSILEVKDGNTEYKFYLTHVEVDGVKKDYTLTNVDGDITTLVIYENEEDTTGVKYIINHAKKTIEQAD